jgi:hypothetical protein
MNVAETLADSLIDASHLIEEDEGRESGSVIRDLIDRYGEGFMLNREARREIVGIVHGGLEVSIEDDMHNMETRWLM